MPDYSLAKPVTLATWRRRFYNEFDGWVITPVRVAVLSENAQGDVSVVEVSDDGNWGGPVLIAYPHEIQSRRPGVADYSGRIYEAA